MLYGLLLGDPVQWAEPRIARKPDEEACICNSPDLIAGMGTNQIAAQERDGARRSLCADWPHCGRQTGLFDEMREFAGPVATASAGRNQCATACGAGGATKRDFRSVLREKETGRIGPAFPEQRRPSPTSMTGWGFAGGCKGPRIWLAGWNVPCFCCLRPQPVHQSPPFIGKHGLS